MYLELLKGWLGVLAGDILALEPGFHKHMLVPFIFPKRQVPVIFFFESHTSKRIITAKMIWAYPNTTVPYCGHLQ